MTRERVKKRRSVGRPAGEPSKDTEKRILDAAESSFARFGYSGARMQQIADDADVTKAMIHYYFENKERLFRAVLDRILFELIKLVQEVTSTESSRVQCLDDFISGFFDYVARHPHFGRLTFLVSGNESRYFDNIVEGFFRPLFARGVTFIENGTQEGVFRPVDAPQLLLSVYASAMGYLADSRFISMVLEDDAMSETALEAKKAALLDMVHALLDVDGSSRKGADGSGSEP